MILEATCSSCNETVIPDESDTVHFEREDGTPCGGTLVVKGAWSQVLTQDSDVTLSVEQSEDCGG